MRAGQGPHLGLPGSGRPASEALLEPGLQEAAQLGSALELRNRIQFLEGRCEGVREAPHGPRPELVVPWLISADSPERHITPWYAGRIECGVTV